MENKFYVYIYVNPRNPGIFVYGEHTFNFKPFYVGKGCLGKSGVDRIDYHWKSVSSYLNKDGSLNIDKIRKYDGNIPKVYFMNQLLKDGFDPNQFSFKYIENLEEKDALNKEFNLIKIIGRRWLKIGPLLNITAGGEYHKFAKPWNIGLTKENDERLRKLSNDRMGSGNPMFGREQSKKYYDSVERKRGVPRTNVNKYKYIINDNLILTDLKNYCKENKIVYTTVLSHFCKISNIYQRKNIKIERVKL